jgi:penicillin-binding protein 2
LSLTIDAELSELVFAALGERRGAVVVSVPQSGEVLAMVSKPSFLPESDPPRGVLDRWSDEIGRQTVAPNLSAALDFPHNPFLFRPIAATYPPGSIFKIVTALAGLEYGAIDARTEVIDEGVLKVGEFEYANWYWRQFGRAEGSIAIIRALARSNDTFFYKVAEWVGPERLAQFARHFSLGERTQRTLSGEREGVVPDPNWKQQQFGEKWYLGNTYHMGIGQGEVLTTPLQLQTLMSTVAARGRKCEPKVLLAEAGSCSEVSLEEESLSLLIRGLRQACSAGGTGYPFFDAPYDVMCKTGTAEFGQEDEQGHRPTHAWFTVAVSRSERQDPEIPEFIADLVVTVLVESDEAQPFREGSADAAPIARTIADWWLAHR